MEGVIEQNKDSYYSHCAAPANHTEGGAELGSVAGIFLRTMVKQKDNLAAKVNRKGAARVIASTFSPDTGTGENARRDHCQGNRRFDRRQPQHIKVHMKRLAEQLY